MTARSPGSYAPTRSEVAENADLGYDYSMNKTAKVALHKRRIKAKKRREKEKAESAKK
jgi:hypothetical protein